MHRNAHGVFADRERARRRRVVVREIVDLPSVGIACRGRVAEVTGECVKMRLSKRTERSSRVVEVAGLQQRIAPAL